MVRASNGMVMVPSTSRIASAAKARLAAEGQGGFEVGRGTVGGGFAPNVILRSGATKNLGWGLGSTG